MARAERWMDAIRRLARASELKAAGRAMMPKGSAQAVLDEATVVVAILFGWSIRCQNTDNRLIHSLSAPGLPAST
jgi:hypothetical protein